MTVAEVVEAFLDHLAVERGLSDHTVRAYRRDLRRYAARLAAAGTVSLDAVRERDIEAHLRGLRTGDADHPALGAASAARAVSAVRGLHRFATAERLVAEDTAREVRPPMLPRRLPKALDVTDVLRLLAVAGDEPYADPRDRAVLPRRDVALLEFLYGTGARVSEAVGCAVDDLDLDESTVLLRGKGGRTRMVPLGGAARGALRAYLVEARPSLAARQRTRGTNAHAVFRNARGGPLSRQGAWGILRNAARRAGLADDVSPHTLRHCFATHLLDGGADLRVVQELLGHASVTTTQVYTLVTVDKLREVYATAHPRAR
jgi:integrase/recombinase XerD